MGSFTARQYFSKLKVGDLFFHNLINAVKGGDNALSQNLIVESLRADDKWLDQIEEFLFSVEQVVKHPKKSIVDQAEIVQVEKAKKISSQSIRHLSSHSNYIRSIDDDGTVHPLKVLTIVMDEDVLIYENRFVYTLILRLLSFLELKSQQLQRESSKSGIVDFNFKSGFAYNDYEIEYDLTMKVKTPLKERDDDSINDVLNRINQLKRRVFLLTGSAFYKQMAKTNPLTPPINRTNLINKNVDYSNCYKLWLFISSFVKTGYVAKVSETELPPSDGYYDDLTYLVVMSLKTLFENGLLKKPLEEDVYEEQEEREFNIEQKINYLPDFKNIKEHDGSIGDFLNLYYYEKIKELLLIDDEIDPNTVIVNKDIAYSFTAFYKQLSALNGKMYEELLSFDTEENNPLDTNKITKKKNVLKYKKELYRRRHLLTSLKKIDYQNALRKESYLLSRIKKLEQELKEAGVDVDRQGLIKSVPKRHKKRKQIIRQIKTNEKKISRAVLNEGKKANTVTVKDNPLNGNIGVSENTPIKNNNTDNKPDNIINGGIAITEGNIGVASENNTTDGNKE